MVRSIVSPYNQSLQEKEQTSVFGLRVEMAGLSFTTVFLMSIGGWVDKMDCVAVLLTQNLGFWQAAVAGNNSEAPVFCRDPLRRRYS